LVIRKTLYHTGLLKDDFRNPDTVRVFFSYPGHGALYCSVPGVQSFPEKFRQTGRVE
jgi:hypothetical protein